MMAQQRVYVIQYYYYVRLHVMCESKQKNSFFNIDYCHKRETFASASAAIQQ